MPKNIEIPLNLCQVLEEEFENMHGPFDERLKVIAVACGDGQKVSVTVERDWDFHPGHVASPAALAERFRNAYGRWKKTDEVQRLDDERGDIATYLVANNARLRGALEKEAREREAGGPFEVAVTEELLNDVLSKTLEDGGAFTRDRFEHLRSLREETRALAELAWAKDGATFETTDEKAEDDAAGRAVGYTRGKADGRTRGKADDRTRFRRLLLEDAFPEEIRRAYDLRLSRVIAEIHNVPGGRSALCLSGGGIRSGTFALGVIQSLAGRGLLGEFDYLSTVSGGGYIGGWLSAWIHRHAEGLRGVVAALGGGPRSSKVEPEPEPLRYLRDYSSFITPRTGLLSADSWTFVVIYIRNLLLNWVVLVPLAASVLMIPRVSVAVVLATPGWRLLLWLLLLGAFGVILLRPGLLRVRGQQAALLACALLIPLAVVGASGYLNRFAWWADASARVGWNAPSALLVVSTILGGYSIAYMRLNRPSNTGVLKAGSFWARHKDQNSFLWLCLLPLCVSASLLTTFWVWFRRETHNADSPRALFLGTGLPKSLGGPGFSELESFLIYGLLLGLTGWLLYLLLTGSRKGALRELGVTLLASLIGALLLYAVAVNVPYFYKPVVEPFRPMAEGLISFDHAPYFFKSAALPLSLSAKELLPYSDWWGAELYACLAFPVYLLLFFLGLTLFVGLTSRRSEYAPKERRVPQGAEGEGAEEGGRRLSFDAVFIGDEDREWLARASGWLFIAAAGWLFFGLLVIFGPLLLFALGNWLAAAGGVSGIVSILGGRSAGTPGHSKKEGKQGLLQSLGVNLIVLASFVFFACLVILVSLLSGTLIAWLAKYLPVLLTGPQTDLFRGKYPFGSAENFRVTHFPAWYYLFALALALQVFGRLASLVVNLNKFSLHAGYRDRIIRAFLGASRLKGERRENPFTGFDPRDNLFMDELRPWQLRETDFREPGGLAGFVTALAGGAEGEDEEARKKAVPDESRRAAARYLRGAIESIKGESLKYLGDDPQSVYRNPSFRTALFADLGRILQVSRLEKAAEFKPYLGAATRDYAELAPAREGTARRILFNRLLLRRAFPESLRYPPRVYGLMHVVNMTLNLVGGKRLAWQQRRAESFTSTPLHSGSLFVGYRPTRDYGGNSGISLGTAVATSGAAANSNMGYFSPSPFVTLVLTFFNARLGWWLGNPGVHGWDTYFRSHPKQALRPVLDEAFGLTDDTNPYVLLSDGGHFENLGLYEMVLRRCRLVVVVDGSADPEGDYDDLGGAVRKIRVDFGIPVEFEPPFLIYSREEAEKKGRGAYCAVGDIHYERVDADLGGRPGKLVYIKPALYGDEPRDIYNYGRSHEDFPHESTADQFFDEPQFESHRMLGYFILESLLGGARPADLGAFLEEIERKTAEERLRAEGRPERRDEGGAGAEGDED